MSGFAGVMALVLAETIAGASVLTWASPLWNETKRSFFTIWIVLMVALFAWPGWWAATSAAIPGDAAAATSVTLALATAVALTLAMILLLGPAADGRPSGRGSAPRSCRSRPSPRWPAPGGRSFAISCFQLLAGAAFLGAAYEALFLGHWYLTDRKLTRTPINRLTNVLIVATCVEGVAIAHRWVRRARRPPRRSTRC